MTKNLTSLTPGISNSSPWRGEQKRTSQVGVPVSEAEKALVTFYFL